MLKNLLIYRVVLFNICVLAILVWIWFQGFMKILFSGEGTDVISRMGYDIKYVMVLVFLGAMVSFFRRVIKTSRAINDVKSGIEVDASKFQVKSAFVGDISVWLVTLGLMGNIVGFAAAIQGLVLTGSQDVMIASFSHMVDGMKIAFYTTLIGTALGLWMSVNYRMLRTATDLLRIDSRV